MNKKGVQVELKTLILIIIIAVVLFIFVSKMIDYFKQRNIEEFCKLNIIAADKASFLGEKLISVECPMQKLVVKSENDNEIKRYIADALVSCWRMVGEGKLFPFGQGFLIPEGTACFICKKIEFDKRLKEKRYEIKNFAEWLKRNNVPGTDINYYEYLTFKKDEKTYPPPIVRKENDKLVYTDELFAEKEYYIVFASFARAYFTEKIMDKPPRLDYLIASDEFDALGCDKIYN